MADYEYVSVEEVRAVCGKIGISDWSSRSDDTVSDTDAETLRNLIGAETLEIPLADFKRGLEIELEHGSRFPDANVSNNHPILTGRIVLAHLKEGLDYYVRLHCMELEMELDAALADGNAERALGKRRDLAAARQELESRLQARSAVSG